MKQCEECGALFEESKTGRTKRFCSDECRWRWWVKHKEIGKAKTYRYECQYCGKEFISYVKEGRKYCSARCAADAGDPSLLRAVGFREIDKNRLEMDLTGEFDGKCSHCKS